MNSSPDIAPAPLHPAASRRSVAPAAIVPRQPTGDPAGVRPADPAVVALVTAARSGDEAAWNGLVAHFDRRLRNVVRTYRLSPVEADDVLQSTWLSLFTHIDQIREPALVGAWLTTVARRECLRMLQRPLKEELTGDPDLGDAGERDAPDAALLAAERRAALERALATLPDRHRRLMTLLATDESPDYREISRRLAMPIGSIGPTRARSLARLQRCSELRAVRPGA